MTSHWNVLLIHSQKILLLEHSLLTQSIIDSELLFSACAELQCMEAVMTNGTYSEPTWIGQSLFGFVPSSFFEWHGPTGRCNALHTEPRTFGSIFSIEQL